MTNGQTGRQQSKDKSGFFNALKSKLICTKLVREVTKNTLIITILKIIIRIETSFKPWLFYGNAGLVSVKGLNFKTVKTALIL